MDVERDLLGSGQGAAYERCTFPGCVYFTLSATSLTAHASAHMDLTRCTACGDALPTGLDVLAHVAADEEHVRRALSPLSPRPADSLVDDR